MELLTSKKFKLPTLYFLTNREEIKDLPIGIPFIMGNEKDKAYFIQLLEWEVLYKRAVQTGLPFNWEKILRDNGYSPVYGPQNHPAFFDYKESDVDYENIEADIIDLSSIKEDNGDFANYINDCTAIIDTNKLKDLKVFPVWLDKIEKAIETNIHNFAIYNPNMYNKKLEGMYGALEFTSPDRNLIICDISGSMTKAIATFILLYSKTMAETFYADILITGSISIVYPYEQIHSLDVDKVYTEVGRGNEGDIFKKLVSEEKHYKTVIVFGDNDHPGGYASRAISDKDGKKLCKWKIDKVISFHKNNNVDLAGYARWFSPREIEKISDWVKYLQHF
jgi:hypothetical protein